MNFLVVVNNPNDWPLELPPGGEVIPARTYLTDPNFSTIRGIRIFNLCRSYRYQSTGYYVSLLAAARGHRVIPTLETVHDLQSITVVRAQVEDDLDHVLQSALRGIKGETFTLHIYFGRNQARRYERLSQKLFSQFPVPFMRVELERSQGRWIIEAVRIIAAKDIPAEHQPFVLQAATEYFTRRITLSAPKKQNYRYDLAILVDPNEKEPPSDAGALKKFCEAARENELRPEFITKDDLPDLPSFDGLFIRATTSVNHYTYRFAVRGAAEGLTVIDDPQSILRCTNKVYLKELLDRHQIRIPRTLVAHRHNIQVVSATLGFPCILKEPDSGFSLGVFKVEDRVALRTKMQELLERSDLLVAQEYLPTEFDWRITMIAGKPLFACRYGMAKDHWQVIRHGADGSREDGWHETLAIENAPPAVVKTALRAARLIGDGLYGVDIKEHKGRPCVIEINDNPSIDAGVEDQVLGLDLYKRIMEVFLQRISERKAAREND